MSPYRSVGVRKHKRRVFKKAHGIKTLKRISKVRHHNRNIRARMNLFPKRKGPSLSKTYSADELFGGVSGKTSKSLLKKFVSAKENKRLKLTEDRKRREAEEYKKAHKIQSVAYKKKHQGIKPYDDYEDALSQYLLMEETGTQGLQDIESKHNASFYNRYSSFDHKKSKEADEDLRSFLSEENDNEIIRTLSFPSEKNLKAEEFYGSSESTAKKNINKLSSLADRITKEREDLKEKLANKEAALKYTPEQRDDMRKRIISIGSELKQIDGISKNLERNSELIKQEGQSYNKFKHDALIGSFGAKLMKEHKIMLTEDEVRRGIDWYNKNGRKTLPNVDVLKISYEPTTWTEKIPDDVKQDMSKQERLIRESGMDRESYVKDRKAGYTKAIETLQRISPDIPLNIYLIRSIARNEGYKSFQPREELPGDDKKPYAKVRQERPNDAMVRLFYELANADPEDSELRAGILAEMKRVNNATKSGKVGDYAVLKKIRNETFTGDQSADVKWKDTLNDIAGAEKYTKNQFEEELDRFTKDNVKLGLIAFLQRGEVMYGRQWANRWRAALKHGKGLHIEDLQSSDINRAKMELASKGSGMTRYERQMYEILKDESEIERDIREKAKEIFSKGKARDVRIDKFKGIIRDELIRKGLPVTVGAPRSEKKMNVSRAIKAAHPAFGSLKPIEDAYVARYNKEFERQVDIIKKSRNLLLKSMTVDSKAEEKNILKEAQEITGKKFKNVNPDFRNKLDLFIRQTDAEKEKTFNHMREIPVIVGRGADRIPSNIDKLTESVLKDLRDKLPLHPDGVQDLLGQALRGKEEDRVAAKDKLLKQIERQAPKRTMSPKQQDKANRALAAITSMETKILKKLPLTFDNIKKRGFMNQDESDRISTALALTKSNVNPRLIRLQSFLDRSLKEIDRAPVNKLVLEEAEKKPGHPTVSQIDELRKGVPISRAFDINGRALSIARKIDDEGPKLAFDTILKQKKLLLK